MEILSSYNLIISASVIIILSFFFGEISKKTNIPSVLMLIATGVVIKIVFDLFEIKEINFKPILEVLGIVGLIMIVLEAALELELKREKFVPIMKALVIAMFGLLGSAWAAAEILCYFIEGMDIHTAWIYAIPLSILSSAIIIPSVTSLTTKKREFHIYESTFSDILGIMVFYFLTAQTGGAENVEQSSGIGMFFVNLAITVAISVVVSYILILVFQKIKSNVKLFLLISALFLLYAVGKKMHLSSLIMILVFGLFISNMKIFFQGRIGKLLNKKKAKHIYEGLHIITGESAFVVRTFFFVVFGITISVATLLDAKVASVSLLIIASIYIIRYIILRVFIGRDIIPQLFVAPRGLITVLLYNAIPEEVVTENFNAGILLFIIISTGIIMTIAMVYDKQRTQKAIKKAEAFPAGFEKWQADKPEDIKKLGGNNEKEADR